jgi:hypothetical protein
MGLFGFLRKGKTAEAAPLPAGDMQTIDFEGVMPALERHLAARIADERKKELKMRWPLELYTLLHWRVQAFHCRRCSG